MGVEGVYLTTWVFLVFICFSVSVDFFVVLGLLFGTLFQMFMKICVLSDLLAPVLFLFLGAFFHNLC